MPGKVYLSNAGREEALAAWLSGCAASGARFPLDEEVVPVGDSLGRVTSREVIALISSPPFNCSAMDGIAVRSSGTSFASEANPVRIELGRDAALVDTGDPVPAEFDAVVMLEDVNEVEPAVFEITRPAAPWQNIRPLGEDIAVTELVLPAGHVISPQDIGALINSGNTEIPVVRRPKVAIIPTGSELVEDPGELAAGKVLESNSRVLAAVIERAGGIPLRMPLVPDEMESISRSLEEALPGSDMVIVNGGTSAGREDFTADVVSKLGNVLVHGVAMKPGKPVVLGVCGGTPVLGLPGFPLANFRGAVEFAVPLIGMYLGLPREAHQTIRARLARKLTSTPGFDEFVQVRVGLIDGAYVTAPLPRGSGVLMSMVRADGVLCIPASKEGLAAGEVVEVSLLKGLEEVKHNVLVTGSHDVSLDLLDGFMRRRGFPYRLAAANVGSLAGLFAVRNCEAHMAGIHLLDPESGTYNIPYVSKHFKEGEALLVRFAVRTQGLIVGKGNPKNIRRVRDLSSEEVIIVNRQRGSGTRVLFDYLLEREGVESGAVRGYENEVPTHTMAAAAVSSGYADAAPGIDAAASALGCDFVPLTEENYDLLVPASFAGTEAFRAVLSCLKDDGFQKSAEALGRYDFANAGEIIEF